MVGSGGSSEPMFGGPIENVTVSDLWLFTMVVTMMMVVLLNMCPVLSELLKRGTTLRWTLGGRRWWSVRWTTCAATRWAPLTMWSWWWWQCRWWWWWWFHNALEDDDAVEDHDRTTPQVGWLKAGDQTILALHKRVITHNTRSLHIFLYKGRVDLDKIPKNSSFFRDAFPKNIFYEVRHILMFQ